MTEAGCLAHARRKFCELWANHASTLAEQALKLFDVPCDVKREVKDLEGRGGLRVRRLESRPAADLRHAWMKADRHELAHRSAIAKASDHRLERRSPSMRFVDNGDLAIALGHKNRLFGDACVRARAGRPS